MCKLAPAGYLLVQESEAARTSNEYRQTFGLYSGVDRLPALFPSDPTIRRAIGKGPFEDVHLASLVEKWFDSRLEGTAFIPDTDEALALSRAFQTAGFQFDLLFCQLAWREGEEERLKAYTIKHEALPIASLVYGFDVSWPTCNHSAILQPGVVPSSLTWRAKLNRYGLLDEYEDARRLREEYLAVYPYPPFDIYLVSKVDCTF